MPLNGAFGPTTGFMAWSWGNEFLDLISLIILNAFSFCTKLKSSGIKNPWLDTADAPVALSRPVSNTFLVDR